jgi:hypothetical protein
MLDEVAFNLRGADTEFNHAFFGYVAVTRQGDHACHPGLEHVSQDMQAQPRQEIQLRPCDSFYSLPQGALCRPPGAFF